MLEKVFAAFLAAMVASALAFSSVMTYSSSRTAGKRHEAHQLARWHLDSVLENPQEMAPPFERDFVEENPTTTYHGTLKVETVPGYPGLWEATTTLTWTERKLTHTVTRKRMMAKGSAN